jgi:hypothetical protein
MIGKGVLVIAAIIVVIAITVGLYASGIDDELMDGSGGGRNEFQHGRAGH